MNTLQEMIIKHGWLQNLIKIDIVLEWCLKYGLLAVIDMHVPPGGKIVDSSIFQGGSFMTMYYDEVYEQDFIDWWGKIALRYKDNKAVWAYDLLNEPNSGGKDCLQIIKKAAEKVRSIDSETTILIPSCSCNGLIHLKEKKCMH